MPLPDLRNEIAHGVLGVPLDEPVRGSEEFKQRLVYTLRTEFDRGPEIPGQEEAPNEVPYLLLHSGPSQAAFSRVQADFEVRFTPEYRASVEPGRAYVAKKMLAILSAWQAVGARPVYAGVVLTLHAPTRQQSDVDALQHLFDRHLRSELHDDSISDAKVQLGLRVADHYFVNLGIGRYEVRQIVGPFVGGASSGVIRPWDGEVTDEGLELTIDVNNRLRAQVERRHTRIDAEEVRAVNDLAWALVGSVATPLIRDGTLDLHALQREVA